MASQLWSAIYGLRLIVFFSLLVSEYFSISELDFELLPPKPSQTMSFDHFFTLLLVQFMPMATSEKK